MPTAATMQAHYRGIHAATITAALSKRTQPPQQPTAEPQEPTQETPEPKPEPAELAPPPRARHSRTRHTATVRHPPNSPA
jgi:hypothetical protein